ncbi:MAG: hypothetical protein RL204_1488, partial [Bacteroidota bacterium]
QFRNHDVGERRRRGEYHLEGTPLSIHSPSRRTGSFLSVAYYIPKEKNCALESHRQPCVALGVEGLVELILFSLVVSGW